MSESESLGDRIIGRAKRHYADLGLRHVDVPEWGDDDGKPLRIYYKPITLSERQAFMREAAVSGGGEFGAVKAIIDKSLDADGRRIFTQEHRIFLLKSTYGPVVETLSEALMSANLKPETPEPALRKGETAAERAEGNS